MSNLSIETIVSAGRRSLAEGNYWSAFIVALSLPSMCSRIEYQNEDFKCKNNTDKDGLWKDCDSGVKWFDKRAYIKWCNDWMSLGIRTVNKTYDCKKDFFFIKILGSDYANKLYEIRCNILHGLELSVKHGGDENSNEKLPILFSIGICNTKLENEYVINIDSICNRIFSYTENWIAFRYSNDLPVQKYYDSANEADQEAYLESCEKCESNNSEYNLSCNPRE